ncbi:MAG: site-specific integrase [Planctomycetes bacterium]|nr:site-specific integrase [Planctomycetota bacterium]
MSSDPEILQDFAQSLTFRAPKTVKAYLSALRGFVHDLRHDFAHRARAAGWWLEEIAVYLGHQTHDGMPAIATTARYTLPSRLQLKKKLQHLMG